MSVHWQSVWRDQRPSQSVLPVTPIRLHHSNGYHIIGRLAIGMRAFGKSIGFELNGASDSPGPHRMKAWKPVAGNVA